MHANDPRDTLGSALQHPKVLALIRRLHPPTPTQWVATLQDDIRLILRDIAEHANRHQQDEETLTYWVANALRLLGYLASPEADQKGHTDLLVKSEANNCSWLAECKILRKYEDLDHGLSQLLDDYSTGYENGLALIVYYFSKNLASAMNKWRERLREKQLCSHDGAEPCDSTIMPSGFSSRHTHPATGTLVVVEHIPVALYSRKNPA